jgi:glycosyltransferase involved in cell wall biosynthesis
LPKKIVFVSNTSWSFFKFRFGIICNLIKAGFDLYLVCPIDEFENELKATGVTIITCKQLSAQGVNPIKDLLLYKELKSIYSKLNPDLIFHFTIKPNIYGSLAARKLGLKSIAVITGLGYTFINKNIVSAIAKLMYKVALPKANRVWFLNEDDKNIFIKLGFVKYQNAAVINGEGIAMHSFPYSEANYETLEFLFIGRILVDKGIREFYVAAKNIKLKFPNIKFSVVGYLNANNPMAIEEQEFMEWVNEGVIHFHGATDDVKPFIKNASCIVLPSYREGLATVLLEGAAMGRPLIASNIAGCKEVIDNNKTGYLVTVKDANDLQQKMLQFAALSNSDKIKMGRLGKEKMETEFSLKIIFNNYLKVIDELT